MTVIAQATFDGHVCIAHSPGFDSQTQSEIESLLRRWHDTGHASLFALPVSRRRWIVAECDGAKCHVFLVPAHLYHTIGDPFLIARTLARDSAAPLTDVTWKDEPQRRSLEQLRAILKADDGPTLLGAAQALIDGGKVVFERDGPNIAALERLWAILPNSTRGELRVCTFAADNELGFDLLTCSKTLGPSFDGCLTDAQAGDYPQGNYELSLQVAVESGDEATVSRLLSRRSSRQALRLVLTIFGAALALGLLARFIQVR